MHERKSSWKTQDENCGVLLPTSAVIKAAVFTVPAGALSTLKYTDTFKRHFGGTLHWELPSA